MKGNSMTKIEATDEIHHVVHCLRSTVHGKAFTTAHSRLTHAAVAWKADAR